MDVGELWLSATVVVGCTKHRYTLRLTEETVMIGIASDTDEEPEI